MYTVVRMLCDNQIVSSFRGWTQKEDYVLPEIGDKVGLSDKKFRVVDKLLRYDVSTVEAPDEDLVVIEYTLKELR